MDAFNERLRCLEGAQCALLVGHSGCRGAIRNFDCDNDVARKFVQDAREVELTLTRVQPVLPCREDQSFDRVRA